MSLFFPTPVICLHQLPITLCLSAAGVPLPHLPILDLPSAEHAVVGHARPAENVLLISLCAQDMYVPLSFTLIRHPKIQFFYTDQKHTISRSLGSVTLKFCARHLGHLTVEPIGRAAFRIMRSGCISAICLSHIARSLAAKSLQS